MFGEYVLPTGVHLPTFVTTVRLSEYYPLTTVW